MNDIINYFNLTAEQVEKLSDQQFDILVRIYKVGSISPMEAIRYLGITKLSTRISEMKAMGIQFSQAFESATNLSGKKVRYMRYRRAAA